MRLYESTVPSGNAYKVSLLLAHLKIPHETTQLDILSTNSESRTPEFLALNPTGHVPVLVLDDGTALAESNAILFYLAEGTPYLPDDKLHRAQVLRWLFFEQFEHEPFVAKWKFKTYWAPNGFDDLTEREKTTMKARGQGALDIMEKHLAEGRDWFVGNKYSIADIGLYVYTRVAEIIGFNVGGKVKAWLDRVEEQDGWVRIRKDPSGKNPF